MPEEPKSEVPSAEEAKAEKTEGDAPKAEESKAEAPTAEEAKPEEPKSEVPSAEEGALGLLPRTVRVERPPGMKLGLKPKHGVGVIKVLQINDGAISAHNERLAQDSPDVVCVGDRIVEINGATETDEMKAIAADTSVGTLTLKILRCQPSAPPDAPGEAQSPGACAGGAARSDLS
jgi:hypothetical protein